MERARVSTTVNAQRLQRARQLLPARDSELFDRALGALIEELERQHELAVLAAQPYDDDPDLSWTVEDGPDLPYDGEIPPEVVALARARRKRR